VSLLHNRDNHRYIMCSCHSNSAIMNSTAVQSYPPGNTL
jgi:hypothetical protein